MARGGMSLPRIARLVVLTALAGGVAWASLSSYLPRAFPERGFSPDRPSAIFTAAGQELIDNQGRLSSETYDRVAAATAGEPLASEPFLLFGFRALGAGNVDSALRLLEEARDRNPRNQFARIALMGLYLRTGRTSEGAGEVAALVRLVPRAAQLLVPELARIAANPANRQAVVDAIGDQPIMTALLTRLVGQNADPEIILALSARQPRTTDGQFAPWQSALLKQLADRGEVVRSYELWRRFVGANPTDLIYDANFTGQPGPPPFNWELFANDVGAAERSRDGGLEIEFFGRKSGPLARQLLMLRPGRYRLEFAAEGNATGQGSRIVVQLGCRGSESTLAEIVLRGLTFTPRGAAADITVPAGCDAQWLAFAGQAAEFPNPQRARITGLKLLRTE